MPLRQAAHAPNAARPRPSLSSYVFGHASTVGTVGVAHAARNELASATSQIETNVNARRTESGGTVASDSKLAR